MSQLNGRPPPAWHRSGRHWPRCPAMSTAGSPCARSM